DPPIYFLNYTKSESLFNLYTFYSRPRVLAQGSLNNAVSSMVDHQLNINQQPAYINLSLGGTEYRAFVDDISREQGAQTSLNKYRF
ncbi:hypothetical protein, partial [Limosilactobacillus fermentum]|uniref:hypothetical protein n=1 Tax=Limosilactobacillus fermentum TaxID=1613 RepID=UPI001D15842B